MEPKRETELNLHDACPVCGMLFEDDTVKLLTKRAGELVIACACNYLLEWNRQREALFVAKVTTGQFFTKGT